jgi:hypothetical protein
LRTSCTAHCACCATKAGMSNRLCLRESNTGRKAPFHGSCEFAHAKRAGVFAVRCRAGTCSAFFATQARQVNRAPPPHAHTPARSRQILRINWIGPPCPCPAPPCPAMPLRSAHAGGSLLILRPIETPHS